jgi:hypothetical protein
MAMGIALLCRVRFGVNAEHMETTYSALLRSFRLERPASDAQVTGVFQEPGVSWDVTPRTSTVNRKL